MFKLSPGGDYKVLHSFSGHPRDGYTPVAGLIADSSGNLYGTTSQGGASFFGTVFKLSPGGTYTVLHTFTCCSDGVTPEAGLIADSKDDPTRRTRFYGTTVSGGAFAEGTVFKLTP